MEAGLPLVSYVLVNWRTEQWLVRALSSIEEQAAGLKEIILVNNASPSWDPAILKGFSQVMLLDLPRNAGFAGGNNAGLRAAGGDYVILLNCDAWLDPDFTAGAIAVFEQNPRVGTVAPKVLRDVPDLDGSWRLDSAGHCMRRDRTAFSRGAGEIDQGQYDRPAYVFGASAAALAYRRRMLDELAPDGAVFDPAFFAYYEDVDLDWRAQVMGWDARYEPACLAYHRGHGSGGRRAWRTRLQAEKNRYLMCLKNDSLDAALADAPALLRYELWHLIKVVCSPVQLLGMLLLLLYVPQALTRRAMLRAKWRRTARDVAAGFVERGPIAPLPALPDELAETGHRSVQADPAQFPLASVVLVNYNGIDLTRACLRGLAAQDYPSIEIIVVDNGSRQNEARILSQEFPGIKTLRLEQNGGFTGGCNWGLAQSRGEWVILMNNDAIPDPDCVRRLVYAQRASGAAAVSGRLVDIDDPALAGQVMSALVLESEADSGEAVLWDLEPEVAAALQASRFNNGLSWLGYIVHDAYGEQAECFYPSGGLCCLPRSTINEFGPELFPQHWFAYYEDVALGFRIRSGGGWVAKERRACAVHLASSTAVSLGRLRLAYLRELNRLRCLVCFLPQAAIIRLLPLAFAQGLGSFAARLVTNPLAAAGQTAAWVNCLASMPALLRDRRRYNTAKTESSQWTGQLCGRMRGRGGIANALALAWCRLSGLPCLEDSEAKEEKNANGGD